MCDLDGDFSLQPRFPTSAVYNDAVTNQSAGLSLVGAVLSRSRK
jgi:hypothetical protein